MQELEGLTCGAGSAYGPGRTAETEVTLVFADLKVLGTGSRCPLHEKWAPDVCMVNREYSRVMIAHMRAHKCNDLDIIVYLLMAH